MYCTKKITSDLIWLGGSDRRLALFENVYPIPRGVSYNAYLIQDEKTALLDTVDQAIAERFFENLEHALQGKPLNYVIVNHMEPDHAATLGTVLSRYPEATVIGNAKTLPMIKQFFPMEVEGRFQAVKEGDTLSLGRHELTFVMAPLVHWPEVMMTYDTTEKALFSADAFGTFGAMDGNIFADEVNFEQEWLDDARRYYTNIVGKYGTPVQNVLKKAAGLDIQYLCPLHGPVWRENIGWFLEKYKRWSTYTPEAWTAAIFCGSIYGHTENACEILASRLAEKGVRHVRIFDVSHTDVSEQVSAAFQCSHLVFASATYNGGIYTPMETLLLELKAHALQNRTVALIENGSWGPAAARLMAKHLEEMKGMEQIAQEGAIQIFREVGGGMEEVVVGVVGVLQLEVLEYRLNTEYNVEIRMQQLPFEQLRWIQNDPDTYVLRDLDLTSDTKAVEDMKGSRLLLFTSDWAIRWAETHNETLKLSEFGNI